MAPGARKRGTKSLGFQDLVEQDLKPKRYRPVYVLAGEDALRAEGVVAKIRDDALGETGIPFNYHILQGDQVDLARVLQQALNLPMLSTVQIIWVKHAERLLGDQDSQARFEQYLRSAVPETILILSLEKVDKRKRWVKAAQELGFLFDFTPPTGEALVQWALKAARREQLPLGPDAARLLCELVGNDLLSLKSEITKLSLLAEDRDDEIGSDEIERIIMDQAVLEGYEITANMQPGRTADVLRTWFRLAEWGRSPFEIAPLILARVRKAALLGAGRQEGMSDREIASLTGANPWSFRYLEPMIGSGGSSEARRQLDAALTCDRLLKSSPLKPSLIIEKVIMDLCREMPGIDDTGRRSPRP